MDTNSLSARFTDAIKACNQRDIPKFLGFLSESELGYIGLIAKKQNASLLFFGGYPDAERRYAGFFPERLSGDDNEHLFPISALTFSFRTSDNVTHRDVLGSLMALGIERETVGDILTESGRAVVFLNDKIAKYVKSQITKIGKVGVTVKEGFDEPLPSLGELKAFTATVASDRIDAVVACIANTSRSAACELIESGAVVLNGATAEKITSRVQCPAVISVRRHGKFNIEDIGGCTKKGRLILKATKYI